MNTKIDELFATLRILITDQTRDLAIAMAELASVAQQRDKALTERDASRAGYSAMNTRIYGPGGECHELDKARAALDALNTRFVRAIAGWNKATIERDNARQSLRAAEQDCDDMQSINSDLRTVNARLIAERDAAMERLNHAESILMQ